MLPDKAAPKLSTRSRAADARRARGEEHTPVTATLRLTRHANGMVIELRRGQFEIELDGKSIGAIAYSETVEAEIDPGHHVLKIRSGRYSSRDLSFDVTDGDVAAFRCHGAMVWPRWLVSFVKPDWAIALMRQ
jgi:hypothetical protein